MEQAAIVDYNDPRHRETAPEGIEEPNEVVFFGSNLRTDEELLMKAKREILKARESKDIVFPGVEPVRGCRVADSLIENGDIESIAARYD